LSLEAVIGTIGRQSRAEPVVQVANGNELSLDFPQDVLSLRKASAYILGSVSKFLGSGIMISALLRRGYPITSRLPCRPVSVMFLWTKGNTGTHVGYQSLRP
jgi:hypothetical protein